MTDIIWKDVKGFEGCYTVSNTGLIKSTYKSKKILKPNKDKDGYLSVTLTKDGKPHYLRVHRVVALTFIPNPDNLPVVNHINKVVDDNRVCNLEWVTVYENSMHGLRTTESILGLASLPLSIIKSIPDLYISGLSYTDIISKLDLECKPQDIGELLSGRRFSETTGITSDIRRKECMHPVKVTDEMVLDIYRRYYELKESQKSLCALYSLSPAQVSRIINGSRRRDLYEAYFLTQTSS